jgi:dTDP-4-amino-4,6-dideoxygalactose transaminase
LINVTKSLLPPLELYTSYLKGIWERGHLTNHGPLVNELEEKMKDFLGVKHFFYVNNGTIALQIAIKALELEGEVITTPFSYVATTSSLVWEQCVPIFADIHPESFTLDAKAIEEKITSNTTAILATHVYGIPCDVKVIDEIAHKHGLKVIYDAAHAFGVKYKKESILNWGDISILSFHATKLFHTVEGGAIITSNDQLAHRISYMRNFGHKGQEDFWGIGINGKNSEFHAAMGLCLFPMVNDILSTRKLLCELYDENLAEVFGQLKGPFIPEEVVYNYAYYPVVFESEEQLLMVRDSLNAAYIYPRRYFYPSLNTLPYLDMPTHLPIAESLAPKVLCLPLYHELGVDDIRKICKIIIEVLKYN